eukprot:11792793-Alexandrium_andersonii.AAC.1
MASVLAGRSGVPIVGVWMGMCTGAALVPSVPTPELASANGAATAVMGSPACPISASRGFLVS